MQSKNTAYLTPFPHANTRTPFGAVERSGTGCVLIVCLHIRDALALRQDGSFSPTVIEIVPRPGCVVVPIGASKW